MTVAATARRVCELLRSYVNDTADIANRSASEVRDEADPHRRAMTVLDGFDRLLERSRRLQADVATMSPTSFVSGQELLADLAMGADQAVEELQSERIQFAAVGPISDDDMSGRVGQFFNALEKAMSVVEPEPDRYSSEELRAAFDAEPSCTFVVQ